MAQHLEKLVVSLEASLKQYERELARAQGVTVSKLRKIEKDAQASVSRVERSMARVGNSIKAGVAGALSAVTFTAVFNGVANLVKKFGELADEAARAGVSAEFLQEVGLAGLGAGVKISELVDLVQKLNLEIGEAATKGGPLADLLEANNVSIRDANGNLRDTQAIFFEIADLIANTRSQQEAAVVAQLAFGKAAKDALPFFQQGADAIKSQMEAAKAAGAVVDEELVKAADEFSDRWDLAWATWEGQAAQRILTVLRLLDGVMGRAQEFFDAGDSAAVSIWKSLTGAATAGQNVSQFDLMTAQGEQRSNVAGKGSFTVIPRTGEKTSTTAIAEANREVATSADEASTELEQMLDTMQETDFAAQELADSLTLVQDSFKDAFGDLVVAAGDGKLKIEELMDTLNSLRDRMLKLAAEKIFTLLFGDANTGSAGFLQSLLIPQRAGGGHVNAGQAYEVGERGRELFVPKQSGQIIPAGSTRGSGGNVIVNNFTGAAVERSERMGAGGIKDIVLTIKEIGRSEFANNLQRFAPAIGAKAASKRTS